MSPVLLPALEEHGKLGLDQATKAKLWEVSAASIDRLPAGVRVVAPRHRPSAMNRKRRNEALLPDECEA